MPYGAFYELRRLYSPRRCQARSFSTPNHPCYGPPTGVPWALVGVLPDPRLYLERVRARGEESGHESAVWATEDQQSPLPSHTVAEGQSDPGTTARPSAPFGRWRQG